MTETESLSIITAMINKAQNRFNESGTLYFLWGWVIFICCSGQFIMDHFYNYENSYRIWYLTWPTVLYQVIHIIKKKRGEKVKTYTNEIIGYVWMAFGICMGLVFFILIKQKVFTRINTIILVLYGVPPLLLGLGHFFSFYRCEIPTTAHSRCRCLRMDYSRIFIKSKVY